MGRSRGTSGEVSLSYQSDVIVVGGGLAGIVTALELSDRGKKVLLLDRDEEARFGGLARESYGGVFLVGTPHQRFFGIKDTPERALQDWRSFAEFDPQDEWPRRWAEQFVHLNHPHIYRWLHGRGIRFFPVVHWVERGMDVPGNSVPRFHMVWGTGQGLADQLIAHLRRCRHVTLQFGHAVEHIVDEGGRASGVRGQIEGEGTPFEAHADTVVVASGGMCGSLDEVRKHWPSAWHKAPDVLLNGSHRFADGTMHHATQAMDGVVTHLDRMWLYAAGVHHPEPKHADHGLSLVPPKSALWVNAAGARIGPIPLVSGFDTRYLVERITDQPRGWTWQVMNRRIAIKELAVSGAEHNPAMRDRKLFSFLKAVLLGNPALVDSLIADCPDFVVANSVEELVAKMNQLCGGTHIDPSNFHAEIDKYDAEVARGDGEQRRRIQQLRQYRGDRVRTCKAQPILDSKAMPLIAIREFLLTRKSLGGIQTDLKCRVLRGTEEPIPGLYAVGEAAGFGGGGIHGLRALEGTFLASCVLTGRIAAANIAGKSL